MRDWSLISPFEIYLGELSCASFYLLHLKSKVSTALFGSYVCVFSYCRMKRKKAVSCSHVKCSLKYSCVFAGGPPCLGQYDGV